MTTQNRNASGTQSSELAGGAGFTFEGGVGGFYLAALLGEAYAPGMEGRTVSRVAFQQRNFGEPLDDVIVDFRGVAGEEARLGNRHLNALDAVALDAFGQRRSREAYEADRGISVAYSTKTGHLDTP
ncbi:hypothetical protein [Steroidobacter denitrificans]|uniref:hypothetical protein n=1 Tax=Steroidobacter denitrificans TaxID=465721 RepID=UPI00082ECFBD|nr:hypothetical protein [Steroidobacter denitrificans]